MLVPFPVSLSARSFYKFIPALSLGSAGISAASEIVAPITETHVSFFRKIVVYPPLCDVK